MLRAMRARSVFIDVGIDQGGIAETSRMTSISAPTYVEEGVVHYGVREHAGAGRAHGDAGAGASRAALRAACSPIAASRPRFATMPGLRAGLQVWDGAIVHAGLAADVGPAPLAPWQ